MTDLHMATLFGVCMLLLGVPIGAAAAAADDGVYLQINYPAHPKFTGHPGYVKLPLNLFQNPCAPAKPIIPGFYNLLNGAIGQSPYQIPSFQPSDYQILQVAQLPVPSPTLGFTVQLGSGLCYLVQLQASVSVKITWQVTNVIKVPVPQPPPVCPLPPLPPPCPQPCPPPCPTPCPPPPPPTTTTTTTTPPPTTTTTTTTTTTPPPTTTTTTTTTTTPPPTTTTTTTTTTPPPTTTTTTTTTTTPPPQPCLTPICPPVVINCGPIVVPITVFSSPCAPPPVVTSGLQSLIHGSIGQYSHFFQQPSLSPYNVVHVEHTQQGYPGLDVTVQTANGFYYCIKLKVTVSVKTTWNVVGLIPVSAPPVYPQCILPYQK